MTFTDFVCLFGKEGRGRARRGTETDGGPTLVHKNGCGPVRMHRPDSRLVKTLSLNQ